jgi:membrane-bound lytic murein transglycosylase D
LPGALAALFLGVGVVVACSQGWIARHQGSPPELVSIKEPSEDNPWSFFRPAWKKNYGASLPLARMGWDVDAMIRNLVNDPRGKLEKEFQVPNGLKDRVFFWTQIYSRFNSRMRVVHDRDNPAIIYGYIDFRPLYRSLGGGNAAMDARANSLEKKIIAQLKATLREASGISKTSALEAAERAEVQALLSRVGSLSPKATEERIADIRTQSGQADFFLQALYRSRNLLPHIESVFRRQNLPVALGRIPFVESSFNTRAYSKGGAIGIWQFMPETARQMMRGRPESQWGDPLRQTESAARVLRMYRSVLPDWGTTVTSYNSGVGRVRRLVEKYKVKDVEGLLTITANDGLGFAGQNFYSEFLAANLVEGYKDDLFDTQTEPADAAVVFKSANPFPKEVCDAQLDLE